jgi:hypothetical protein
VRSVCVQFQPDRVTADETRVRQALRTALPDAEIAAGEDKGRYENIMFDVESPEVALSKIRDVLDSPSVGPAARASCIVTCEGENGWDDYLLLHHFDPTENRTFRPTGLPNNPACNGPALPNGPRDSNVAWRLAGRVAFSADKIHLASRRTCPRGRRT